MTRRTAIAAINALGAAALAPDLPAQKLPDQTPRFGRSAPKRTAPMLCVYSQNLIRVPYPQLGDIASQIGYEGVDLTVYIGGHVDPRITNVDLVRAFESIRNSGLEVPMVSTNIVTAADPTCYPVLYLTGHSQIPLFRLGYWPAGETKDTQQRLAQVRQDLMQIAGVAQRCDISAMFPNRAGGFVGQSVADAQTILGDMDPHSVGYYFDPAEATIAGGPDAAADGWEAALRLALPRLKALSLQDFSWKKDSDRPTVQKCPLGQGLIDWQKFFAIVAASHFLGPVSLHFEYAPQDALGAMAKDLEFARTNVQKAWAAAAKDDSRS